MVLTLNLSPELEQYLAQEASRQGLSIEAVALRLLTNALEQQAEAQSSASHPSQDGLAEAWGRWFESVDQLEAAPSEPVNDYQQLLSQDKLAKESRLEMCLSSAKSDSHLTPPDS